MMKNLLSIQLIAGFLLFSTVLFGQYSGMNPDVATSKAVTVSDTVIGNEPGLAVDGLPETYCAIPGDAPAWLQIDLEGYYFIDGFGVMVLNPGELPSAFGFQVSADEAAWLELGTYAISDTGTYSYDVDFLEPIRFIRLEITSKDALASFAEVMVYGEELMRPDRPDALPATDITTSGFRAHWEQLPDADGYVISVATDPGFTSFLPGYSNYWVGGYLAWNFAGLEPGTDFYYRVRAYNLAGSSTWGTVASVTTLQESQDISFEPLDEMVYGTDPFELTATASSGLPVTYASSDEGVATVSGSVLTIVGVGTTTITASQEGNDQYLPASSVDQDLVVGRKELTVEGAAAESKMYDGTTDAVITGASLNGVVGTDDVTLTGADAGVFAQAEVGTGITVTLETGISGADTAKYNFIPPADLSADITVRELTVTADDQSREECAENPDFTFSYSGFAEGEDESVLTEEPLAECSADAGSSAGTYDITVSGGSGANYTLVYVTGTLTVSADATPPALSVQNITVQIGESGYVVVNPADLVVEASDNCTLSDTTLSQTLFTAEDIGTVNVDVTLIDAAGNETTEVAEVTVEGSVGIRDVARGVGVSLYPNPTHGIIYLEMKDFADEMKVMDMTGRMILHNSHLNTRNEVIDLTPFHNGMYLIQIRFGEEVIHFNVIKN